MECYVGTVCNSKLHYFEWRPRSQVIKFILECSSEDWYLPWTDTSDRSVWTELPVNCLTVIKMNNYYNNRFPQKSKCRLNSIIWFNWILWWWCSNVPYEKLSGFLPLLTVCQWDYSGYYLSLSAPGHFQVGIPLTSKKPIGIPSEADVILLKILSFTFAGSFPPVVGQ